MDIRKINDQISVSPQIAIEDVAAIKAAGFKTIINNRPDGEEPGQPLSDDVKREAEKLGLDFVDIPMGRDGVSMEMISQTCQALASGEPVFAYCRSGMRSTTLWALSQAGAKDPDEIIKAAAQAGYDIAHLTGHLASGPVG